MQNYIYFVYSFIFRYIQVLIINVFDCVWCWGENAQIIPISTALPLSFASIKIVHLFSICDEPAFN